MGTLTAIKLGLGLLSIVTVVGGGWWFIDHERDIGKAQCVADVKAAVDTEKARQADINQYWHNFDIGAVADADKQKAKTDDLEKQVAVASAPLKGRACLPIGVVDKLRAIDLPGGQAQPATGVRKTPR